MRQAIIEHFAGDFTPFFSRFLEDLKSGGAGNLKARCPFHDDQSPSLSISVADGRWQCLACGAKGDVFSFFAQKHGLDAHGQFPEVLRGIAEAFGIHGGNGAGKAAGATRRIVKAYDYRDSAGNIVFRKNRFEPKSFNLCRPDNNGGWVNGMGGVEPVLYRLPEVLAAGEVWIVEGEKDSDNMAGLGFVATTNFDGAGKWRESYTAAISGKRIVILPDQDDAGRKHGELVASALYGVAASVKVLQLPNPTGKKGFDVSDWLSEQPDRDTAAEQLCLMAEGAAEWMAQAAPETDEQPLKFQFVHAADILADLKPTEWRVKGILTDCALFYTFGDPGHFKTFVELDRLLCIASGIDYHGHKVKQGVVFYICGEGQQGIGRRIAAWHIAHGTRAEDVPFFIAKTPTQLMDLGSVQEVQRSIDAMAERYGPPAVVSIDTLARNFGDGDENATRDMNAAISNLDLAFRADFCRGLTHHTGHANKDRARGSIALHGAADCAFRVSLTDAGQVVVEGKKMKDAPLAPLMIFERREILLQIGGTEDRSYVLDLAAEGDEARALMKPKKAVELKGSMARAVGVLRNLYVQYRENLKKGNRASAKPQVSYIDWRAACMVAGLYKHTDTFRRACDVIVLSGLVAFDETRNFVYLKETIDENGD